MSGGSSKTFRFALIAGLSLFVLGSLFLALFSAQLWIAALRWIGLAVLVYAGRQKRSLTYWIFFAMLFGLELGLAWPDAASRLRVLSDIFLRLIKVIVAPLILGTLVTGIAGHGDMRKVGRIGWKSIQIYGKKKMSPFSLRLRVPR